VGVNLFSRAYSVGDVLAIHQIDGGPTVRGAFVRRTRRHWIVDRHSIDAGDVLVESRYERALVPVGRVAIVEVIQR
jgi:hypothetical protein